jgi:hypothetical protein
MTEEEVIREGRISGIDFFDIYDWTWGEVEDYVDVQYEKERRKRQDDSLIAYIQAQLTIRMMTEKEPIILEEEFPYWTEEEQTELRIDRLKKKLLAKSKHTEAGTCQT